MHIFRSALILALLAAGALAQTTNRWEKDIAAFEAQDRTNPPPKNAVLFIGSSSIRLWKTLAQDSRAGGERLQGVCGEGACETAGDEDCLYFDCAESCAMGSSGACKARERVGSRVYGDGQAVAVHRRVSAHAGRGWETAAGDF